jgi:ferredoxin-NADP reductase
MAIYKIKLVSKDEIAKGTLLFTFEKPDHLTFKPGQYGGFTLIDPPETDTKGMTRRFSLLSTPDHHHLSIATRMQNSAYKRVLNQLEMGSEIKFAGPAGTFTLHEDTTTPAVLIAGGIGITPFYSMICYITQHRIPLQMTLFYGSQQIEEVAFLNELTQLQQHHLNFSFIPTLTNAEHSWAGERGLINSIILEKYIPQMATPIYYICGSPAMVTTLQETLTEMGITRDCIRTEDFPGY